MSRVLAFLAAVAIVAEAAPAFAQPATPPPGAAIGAPPPPAPAPAPPPTVAPPPPVQVTQLAAPDAFSTPGRDTGLPPTLWRGASLAIVKAVLPQLAERTLPPAAAALARRVLATGAPGPEGAGSDPALTAARAAALIAQGDPQAAAAILARAPGLDRNADLARVAAEAELLAGRDGHACQIEEGLTSGRDDIYWLRLRTYCEAVAGKSAEAQLTFDVAQAQAKDPVFARLMAAKLAGAGDPGAASLRSGLDLALSRSLGLDLSQARASPEVAAALAAGGPSEPAFDVAAAPPDLAPTVAALVGADPLPPAGLERLLDAAEVREPKARARGQAAALLCAPFFEPLGPTLRARVAALNVPQGRASAARLMILADAAADQRLGETALVALWLTAEAGPAGLSPGERAQVVRALRRAGFERDARAFALEGLLALK
ncbi:hypothetical protein [Phenylobacterium sp.]|uniref:hypothetical protein n=1 Tax=Phenylobacterium sp. TaxID=1871053 RepID=UPI00261CE233|nr:hypothetical protein [Phenylobacterium sp.]